MKIFQAAAASSLLLLSLAAVGVTGQGDKEEQPCLSVEFKQNDVVGMVQAAITDCNATGDASVTCTADFSALPSYKKMQEQCDKVTNGTFVARNMTATCTFENATYTIANNNVPACQSDTCDEGQVEAAQEQAMASVNSFLSEEGIQCTVSAAAATTALRSLSLLATAAAVALAIVSI